MKHDLIIYDCDGTLTDSEYAYNACSVAVFAEYGLSFTIEHAFREWMGKSQNDIIKKISQENDIDLPADEVIGKFVSMVPSFQKKYLKPIDGALDAVRILNGQFKTCVASNGERPNIINSLRLLGFEDFFSNSQIFSKNDVARAKPFPDLFLHACEKMNSTPDKAIVIEDSISGVKAGRAANMYTIGFNGVGHGDLQSSKKLMQAGADIVFSNWKDILLHINS